MKNVRKILGLILILALVITPFTAFAANITIDDGASEGAVYSAYKLMTAENDGDAIIYTVNPKYSEALKTASGKTTDDEVIDYISGLNDVQLREFADKVFLAIKNEAADYTSQDKKFADVDKGYYLIAETTVGTSKGEEATLVILNTAKGDDLTVKTKESTVTVEKKVKDQKPGEAEATWKDGAAYNINDDVPFKLTGSLSENIGSYKTYKYEFQDELSTGLTFNDGSVKVTIDGTEITGGYKVTHNAGKLNITFDDLKAVTPKVELTKDSKVVVEYTAKLNDQAVIGQTGNPNKVKLVFSNNPYGDGQGETPEDRVIVFTFQLDVNKVDGKNNPLAGAGFTLYRVTEAGEVAVGQELKGVTTFNFKGLDEGKYVIKETTVPTGYNKAADLTFTVSAVYDENSADPKLTELKVDPADKITVTLADGKLATDFVNMAGEELPSTGGVGRTMIYLLGAVLVVLAGVQLVVRKKTNK